MMINNYSQNNNLISFKQLNFKNLNGIKLFEEIHCKAPKKNLSNEPGKDYFVKIENDYTPEEFYINIDDNHYNEIGGSKIIFKKDKTLYNEDIYVKKNNLKYSGAGTAMRLGQIITMLENDIDKIKLYSLGSAVHFHSKFKFEPDVNNPIDLQTYLKNDIIMKESDKRFEEIAKEAAEWCDKKNISYEEKVKLGNKILYKYLQTINKYKLNFDGNFQICPGFNMVLTKDKVLKNKEFFNNLFEKFGIDYKINDLSDL